MGLPPRKRARCSRTWNIIPARARPPDGAAAAKTSALQPDVKYRTGPRPPARWGCRRENERVAAGRGISYRPAPARPMGLVAAKTSALHPDVEYRTGPRPPARWRWPTRKRARCMALAAAEPGALQGACRRGTGRVAFRAGFYPAARPSIPGCRDYWREIHNKFIALYVSVI